MTTMADAVYEQVYNRECYGRADVPQEERDYGTELAFEAAGGVKVVDEIVRDMLAVETTLAPWTPERELLAADGAPVPIPAEAPATPILWRWSRPLFADVRQPAARMRQVVVPLPAPNRDILRLTHETYVRRDGCGRLFLVRLQLVAPSGATYPDVHVLTRREREAEAAWGLAVRLLARPSRLLLLPYGDDPQQVRWFDLALFDAWVGACYDDHSAC